LFFSKICDDFFPQKTRENATIKNIFSPTFVQNSAHKMKGGCMPTSYIHWRCYMCAMSQCFYKSRCPMRKFHLNWSFLMDRIFMCKNSFNMPEIQCISWRIFGAWFWTSLVKVEGMIEGLHFLENILSLGYSCSPLFYFFES
jgi:hypothetical protein